MVLFYKTKNVTDMLQHGKNTCFCSRGQNMPLICCSIVKIHGSVPSDEKRKKSLTCFSMVRKQGSISVLWDEKCP